MATDARAHIVPAGSGHPARADLTALSLSLNDPIVVASVAARAIKLADLAAVGVVPSATNPIHFWRQDAGTGKELESTIDGTTFQTRRAWFDTDWSQTSLTPGSSWSLAAASGFPGLAYRLLNGQMTIYGIAAKTSWAALDTIATLPATSGGRNLLPSVTWSPAGANARVETSGAIRATGSGSTNIVVALTFPVTD